MKPLFRLLSAVFFVLALVSVATLLIADIIHGLRSSSIHRNAGALSLMMVGLSYVFIHLHAIPSRKEAIKAVSLGLAFFLWGCEQFLPPSRLIALIDSVIITVFVVDLSLSIAQRLKRGK